MFSRLPDFVGAISIHVLRAEDDPGGAFFPEVRKISIHVLRAEDDVESSFA